MIHFLVFIVALLITAHYTTWLYAKLTVITPYTPVNDFESMLEDGSFTLGLIKGWSVQTEIEVRNVKYMNQIYCILIRIVHTIY